MEDCLFCKIVKKEINSNIIYENDDVLIFEDIDPKAPVHLLAIPKQHIDSIMEIGKLDGGAMKKLFEAITDTAKKLGLEEDGFRIVTNTGIAAGQSVGHLHFHIMGKRKFEWPPG